LDYQNLLSGLYCFSIGLFKKVIIADTFANAVSWGFSNVDAMSSLDIFIVSLCYTFQLYFDFSGYCDMAIGTSRMFNIELPINFNSPYQSTSIIDFWGRWHLTLTQFLREYIYFPLGGSKKGKIRTYANIMIIFLISGIWHGANWTFIVWGLLHGFLNCLNRIFQKTWEKTNVVFQWMVTFTLVDFLWLLFRAESLSQAVYLLKKMMCMDSLFVSQGIIDSMALTEISFWETHSFSSAFKYMAEGIQYFYNRIYGFNLWAFLLIAFFIVLNLKNTKQITYKRSFWRSLSIAIMLVWSMVSFTGVSTYIYAGF
jgi:D-alanyl-lipoteichoic acid acyltransferase DltB (MBOAT superfamily)